MILTAMDGDDLPHPVNADIVKNTMHNQRPARLSGLGKNKGFPTNQKGSGKNKGCKWKKLYTRQVENLKRRLGKKGYPGGLKTQKGGPGKN